MVVEALRSKLYDARLSFLTGAMRVRQGSHDEALAAELEAKAKLCEKYRHDLKTGRVAVNDLLPFLGAAALQDAGVGGGVDDK